MDDYKVALKFPEHSEIGSSRRLCAEIKSISLLTRPSLYILLVINDDYDCFFLFIHVASDDAFCIILKKFN